jgi:hypothetical protein
MSRHLFIQHIKTQSRDDPFRFYVYAYLRSKDSHNDKAGTPYYIGKGCGRRAYGNHKTQRVPKDKNFIVFLETHLSEIGALALERRYINWYGRKDNSTGILMNFTDGGDFSYGIKMTEEHKRKIGAASAGRKHSQETKRKIKEAQTGNKNHFYGKTHSEETRLKLSIAASGKSPSEETRRKLSMATKGIKHKTIVCPPCNKEGGNVAMKRYHFDNCKTISEQ